MLVALCPGVLSIHFMKWLYIVVGDYGCIVNGQLSVDRTDLVDGHKGVMMKMLIGELFCCFKAIRLSTA